MLSNANLSEEDRLALSTMLADKTGELPFRDIIRTDEEGRLTINDLPLTIEEIKVLREGAISVLNSMAWKTVRDQIASKAVSVGVHNGDNIYKMLFSRTALWWFQEEEELLKTLAQQ